MVSTERKENASCPRSTRHRPIGLAAHLDWGSAIAAADRRRRFCASHSYVVIASAADFAVHLDDWAHGSPGLPIASMGNGKPETPPSSQNSSPPFISTFTKPVTQHCSLAG